MQTKTVQQESSVNLPENIKEKDTHHKMHFAYTESMKNNLLAVPLLIALVGMVGNSGQTCGGSWMPMYWRIPLVISGLIGLGIAGAATLAGSIVTVPLDLAINVNEIITEKYKNYNKVTFYKPIKEETKLSQLPLPESPKPVI